MSAFSAESVTETKAVAANGYEWGNVPLGANGFITGIVIHPTEPDLIYCRTDVGGCYSFDVDSSTWYQLNDSFGLDWQSFYQIDGIALDANNPDIIYIAAGGPASWDMSDILKSEDRGKSWKRLNFKGGVFSGNGSYRGWGECIAVDPVNSNIVYCGTYNTGLWRSANGGSTWEQVYNTSNPVRSVVFDKKDGRNVIYTSGYNEYLRYSDDGGVTWKQNTDVPQSIKRMSVDSKGTLYMAGYNSLSKLENGVVSDISPQQTNGWYNDVTVSPVDDNYIICLGPHTNENFMSIPFWESTDGGKTWTNKNSTRRVTSTLRWDSATDSLKDITSNAHRMLIDPLKPERVWVSDWFCVSMTENIKEEPYQKWDYLYKGIEEVCPRDFICPSEGKYRLIAAVADIDGVVYSNYKEYPERRIRANRKAPWMMGTSAMDYCKAVPSIVVRVGIDYNSNKKAEISYDNTETWQDIAFRKADNPSEYHDVWQFGQVAVSAQINPDTGYPSIVVIPCGRVPLVSLDGGYSWSKVEGITDTIISSEYWNKGIYLSSDGADGATFYIQDRNAMTGTNSSVYVSRDWGLTWEKTTTISGAWYPDKTFIKCAPGIAGDVWSCAGGRYMYHSTDYGKTWSAVAGISDVQCFGFGKNAPGLDYPALYAYATVNGTTGVYRSIDAAKSWQRINDDNHKIGRGPYVIEGDMQSFGVVYIGTGGRGIFYGKPVEGEYKQDFSATASGSDWVKFYDSNDGKGSQLVTSNGYSVSGGALKNSWNNNFMHKRYCIYNATEWPNDIRFKADIKNDGGNDGNIALMMFGYKDRDNYYFVSADGGNNISLSKRINGTETLLKKVHADGMYIKGGATITVIRFGNNIKVKANINGEEKLLINVEDSSLSGGVVGLGSLYSVCEFDNIHIMPQTEAEPDPVSSLTNVACTRVDDIINVTADAIAYDKNAIIYAASYNAQGRLLCISEGITVNAGTEPRVDTQLKWDEKISYIKLFMWNSSGTAEPLCNCVLVTEIK